MRSMYRLLCGLFLLSSLSMAADETMSTTPNKVRIQTSLGNIVIQLNTDKAPITTKNFIEYVEAGFYNGTIFHRVIPGFMAQGGGFTQEFTQKETRAPIKNEANNGLLNTIGTVAMARTPVPDSATSQFFINYSDNTFLNHTAPTPQGWGYAVFGSVVEGMDVVEAMAKVPTGSRGPHQDVPTTDIVIEKAEVITE